MAITYPSNPPQGTDVVWFDSTAILPQPYNAPKVGEIVIADLAAAGFTDNIWIPDLGSSNLYITVAMLSSTTQQQRDAVMAAINIAAADPHVNDLTADQQDNATVSAKIDAAKANRDAIRGPRDANGVQTGAGLKDQVNGNATFSVTGIKPPLVKATFNGLANDAARIEALRVAFMGQSTQQGTLDILIALLNAMLDGTQADMSELRLIRDRLLNNGQ